MTDRLPEETDSQPTVTLGRRIASRRALLGMKQEEVASRLGITRVWYGQIELDNASPSLDLLTKMATLFDVTETWLLRGDPHPASAA
jgi:transcriptional regulator with XRE-family HTH domain